MKIWQKFLGSSILTIGMIITAIGGSDFLLKQAWDQAEKSYDKSVQLMSNAQALNILLSHQIIILKDLLVLETPQEEFDYYNREKQQFLSILDEMKMLSPETQELELVDRRYQILDRLATEIYQSVIAQDSQILVDIKEDYRAINSFSRDINFFTSKIITIFQNEQNLAAQTRNNLHQTEQIIQWGILIFTLLVFGGQFFLILLPAVRSIKKLQAGVAKIRDGNLGYVLDIQTGDEVEQLAQEFNRMTIKLAESYRDLEEKKECANAANQAKSEFLANMSHELRTPLNGILGYAQILGRSKVIPEKERHGINIIHQCGSHLLTLINDVLDLSKIEARKLELFVNGVYLPSLLQSVIEIYQIRAQQKSINFYYEADPHLPSGVIVDEKRLRQVLLNLLGNAIKFTDRGSVTLKVERLNSNNPQLPFTHLRFSVIDTGVGIAPEDMQKLFRSFEQVGDRSRQAEGTGLGLAISQQIVQLMGGKIEVQSQPGEGSQFSFKIKLPLTDNWRQQNDKVGHIISYNGTRKRILVIDDRWENRSVIVNLLEPLGFEILEAEHGKDALEKMREQPPDLVITDLEMPIMNGFEMLKQIRNDEQLKQLKVLVSSASVAQADQQMSLDAGGDDFLGKPVDARDLFNALTHHLNITWNSEEIKTKETSTISVGESLSELIAPDLADLQVLLELAQEGRLKKLVEVAEKITNQDDRYQPFIQQILQLAKQFQSEKIEEFIQHYLPENQALRIESK